MAESVIDLCNRALDEIGEESITALSDSSLAARKCNRHYTKMRDEVLRAYPWTFAQARAQLAASGTTPAFGFNYQYQLPSDCLRVNNLFSSGMEEMTEAGTWKKEGRLILTDETAPLYLVYTKRETDPVQYDPLFDAALVARLAATLAMVLTKSGSIQESQWAIYKQKLAEAQFADSVEAPDDGKAASEWINVRS